MPEIPECLNRRYQALDDLIKDLSSPMYPSTEEDYVSSDPANDAGLKLMCNFWNILKEDPDCNLTQAVRQHMGLSAKASRTFHPQRVTCYMACKNHDDRRDAKTKHICGKSPEQKSPEPRVICCSSKSVSPKSSEKSDAMPLSKVLCNLKEAVSFDKKCNIRIGELLAAEKQLQDQIQHLEHREKEGIKMLKQADCMWSCMEEAYKKKVAESQERQNALLDQLKEVEASNNKWRKNKKDLEFQCDNVNKCYFEITEKMNEKKNDVKCIKMEVENLKKRMESNKKDTETVKKSFSSKKSVSDAKVATLSAEIAKMNKKIKDEIEYKHVKEAEGTRYVKEARDDLQKICRVLLQKRLENEDLKAEKESVLEEIDILKKTCDQCKEKCQNKQQNIIDEIAKVDSEIAGFKVRCIRCHECTDTADVRKFCTDCPRCVEERDCLIEDNHCIPDTAQECVCMSTKERFLDNVFDNMYTVLERQVKTGPGKVVAEAVLNCLKRSRNGKLNGETKKILQDFILTTVRKNLNLTIIGGAVKTRCEMDAETYKQLMLCLKQVKTVKAPKVHKGTAAKKEPCRRWGGTSECNCPKGPKGCICTRKAPLPPNEPEPCPPSPPNKEDAGEVMICPHKDSIACGADCAMHGVPSAVGAEVASWRPAPCDEKQCQFSKNMRAAQCVLGPDSLSSVTQSKGYISTAPYMLNVIDLEDQITCKCGPTTTKPCSCRKGLKTHPRERIIEEVIGRYTDVTSIEKVKTLDITKSANTNLGTSKDKCVCSNFPIKELSNLRTSANKTTPICACASSYILSKECERHYEKLRQKKHLYLCRKSKDFCDQSEDDFFNLFPDFRFQCSEKVVIGVKDDVKLAILTCPKIGGFKFVDKSINSRRIKKSFVRRREDFTKDKSVQNSGLSLFGRVVCDTVKELIKEIVISDTSNIKYKSAPPDVEWITIESLLREISSLTRLKSASNTTINETEVHSEFLSDPIIKYENKYSSSIHDDLKKSSKRNKESLLNYLFISNSYGDSPLISRHNSDIKHLNVEVDQCDESTCAIIWKEAKETIKSKTTDTKKTDTKDKKMVEEKKSPIKGDKTHSSNIKREEFKIKSASNNPRNDKKDSVKHRQMLSKSTEPKRSCLENKNVTFRTDPEPKNDQKKCSCDKYFKVSIEKERGQFTKLTNTPSGSLAMELDESLIKKIEQKMERNSNMTVSFLRSKSGHLLVDFSPQDSSINTQKINVNRSSSGALIFAVDKNVVNILKTDADDEYLELDNKSSISVSITPKKARKDTEKDGEFEQGKIIKNNDILERENSDSVATIRKKMKSGIMKIKGINGAYTTVKTNVTKTDSGISAFIIAEKSSLGLVGVVLDKNKEYPVLLSESPSGSLLLNDQSATPNATIRKTESGNILVVKVNSSLNSTETKTTFSFHKPQDIFKVSLSGSQHNVGSLPIALKSTPSENYVVVMDKEYETCYRKTIKEHLDLNYHCPLELSKTTSGNYMASLVKNDQNTEANAFLARSLSGTIKVVRNTYGKRLSTSSSTSSTECPSKIVKNLLNTLPVSSYKLEKDKVDKPRLIETKSSSDSNLFEKVKIQLHNQQNLLTQPSALLKKTSSGQYAVVLNKESKKNFINNLKTYLASNSQGFIPIKRTRSGEITIVLNSDNESKGQYGSLKITPSGNIYILVDEKVMRGMVRNDDIKQSTTIVDHLVRHDINADENLVNKGVKTTCNAFPDESCNPSQCICGDLLKHGVLESYSNPQCSFKFCQQKESDMNRCELKCIYKCCDCGQCPENCDVMRFDENSPHIVIKPCNCRSKFQKSSEPDSLYYFTEAVCPFHKDRYESLSNEIIEISGLCKKTSKMNTRSKKKSQNHSNQVRSLNFEPASLDNLDYLPPQLPHFLRDFRCA